MDDILCLLKFVKGDAIAGLIIVAINMFGGFAVTQRMLDMFRR